MISLALRASPALVSSDAQLLLRDTYETLYGIYNHEADNPARPLAVMGMHAAEDAHTGSLLYERIEQFGEKEVFQFYGLNLVQFLDLPRDIGMKILETCEKLKAKKGREAEAALAQFGGKG